MTGDAAAERVERLTETWNANDWEAMESLFRQDTIVEAPESWPETGAFRGWQAIREQFKRIKSSWSEERLELVETKSNGDRAFCHFHWITKGEASGVPIEAEMFACYSFRDGLVERVNFTTDRAHALELAGIKES